MDNLQKIFSELAAVKPAGYGFKEVKALCDLFEALELEVSQRDHILHMQEWVAAIESIKEPEPVKLSRWQRVLLLGTTGIALLLLILQSTSYADHRVYLGQDDTGKMYAGMEATLPLGDIGLRFDVKSTGLHETYTYYTIAKDGDLRDPVKKKSAGFVPAEVIYIAEINYGNVVIGHRCIHRVDTIIDNTVPPQDPTNYIQYKAAF